MKTKNVRANNYDLLRVLATVAVIILHVSALFINAITDVGVFGELYRENMLFTCIVRASTVFAVPCFMMLSGAFLLTDKRNADYEFFYKKRFYSIGIPTLIFSGLYVVYNYCFIILRKFSVGIDLLKPICNLLNGEPYYHMWYLFMLLGVYALVPVVLHVMSDIGEKMFSRVSVIFLILACPSGWALAGKSPKWNIGYSFCFLGYLMIGYTIRKWAECRKNNKKGVFFLLAGVIILIVIGLLRYEQALKGIADSELVYGLVGPFNPLVVIASVLIFCGFSLVEVKRDFSKLSAVSFYIYLFHGGVLTVVQRILLVLFHNNMDNRIFILIATVVTFLISWLASKIYLDVWHCGEKIIKEKY